MKNKIIALDIGEIRIGVAVSDALGFLAHPLTTLTYTTKEQLVIDLQRILSEQNISEIVIGIPYTLKGSNSIQTEKTLTLFDYLQKNLDLPLVKMDERLTTKLAAQQLKESGKKASKNRAIIDQLAAINILQTYLDKKRNQSGGI